MKKRENKKEEKTILIVSDEGTNFKDVEDMAKDLIKDGFKVISHHHTDKGMIEQVFE